MTTMLDELAKSVGSARRSKNFKPAARYHDSMDFLLYVQEDCAYRADRVDEFLTLLWHPHEHRLVGLKLKGFRFIFRRASAILDLKESDFLPLVQALEVALTSGLAQRIMVEAEKERIPEIEERYNEAKTFARKIRVSPDELKRAS